MTGEEAVAWSALLDLAERRKHGWTLVGGQMVHLLAWDHGETSPRATTDADAVLDVRAYQTALRDVTARLIEIGFVQDGVSPDGIGHRCRHSQTAKASIDVHSRLVAKAAAYQAEAGAIGAQRHLRDFVYLVTLHARHYPTSELTERLTKKDRTPISNALGRLQPANPIWGTVPDGPRDLEPRGPFEPLPVDDRVSRSYGLLASTVVASGRRAQSRALDLMIAATAHAHQARLYPRNPADLNGLDKLIEIVSVA